MEIIYRAADGTDFVFEDECMEYESKLKIAAMNLKSRFFDSNGVLMDINDLFNCIENGYYMELATVEEAKFIAEYSEKEVGMTIFSTAPTIGRYYWDEDSCEWYNVEKLYAAYADKLKIFEG